MTHQSNQHSTQQSTPITTLQVATSLATKQADCLADHLADHLALTNTPGSKRIEFNLLNSLLNSNFEFREFLTSKWLH